jgi:hypothetical protein
MTLTAMLLLSSCAPDANRVVATGEDPAGFWMGLWHGIIFPITFVISLFSDDVSVYEVVNRGNWYDLGFILGVMMSLGGGGRAPGRSVGVEARLREPHVIQEGRPTPVGSSA